MDELSTLIKEAIDRRSENVRRRKRRDLLRLALVRIFKLMAENGIFAQRSVAFNTHTDCDIFIIKC